MRRFLALSLLLFISITAFPQSADTRNYIDFIYSNNQAETDIVDGLKVGGSTVTADNILDEDDMVSDSPTGLVTQQSVKAYVDAETIDPPVSSTDECVARWDGVTALVLQDSVVCITDAGVMSGIESAIFNSIAAPAHQEGLVFYDNSDKSLSYYNEEADITVNIGRESLVKVRNTTGVTIPDGSAVYISGASGNRPTIALARSDSRATLNLVGLTTHSIENNTNGYMTVLGQVNDLDTSSFTAGDALYVDATTAGALTNVKPTNPNYVYEVGVVEISNPTNGSITVLTDDLHAAGGTDTYVRFSNGDGFFAEDADFTYDIATDILSLVGLTTSSNITMTGTGGLYLPDGDSAARPAVGAGDYPIRYNTDISGFEGYDGSAWGTLGGGAGTVRIYEQEKFEAGTNAASFTCGTNLTAADDTTTEIAGLRSLTVTQGATPPTVGIECAGPTITLDTKAQDTVNQACFTYTYDGVAGDIALNIYDNTNTVELAQYPFKAKSEPFTDCLYFNTSGTASIDYDFEVLVQNANAILKIDDIEFKTGLDAYDAYASSEAKDYTITWSGATASNNNFKGWRDGDKFCFEQFVTLSSPSGAAALYFELPDGLEIDKSKSTTEDYRSNLGWWSRVNTSTAFTDSSYSGILTQDAGQTTRIYPVFRSANDTAYQSEVASTIINSGDSLTMRGCAPIAGWSDKVAGAAVRGSVNNALNENVFNANFDADGTSCSLVRENVEWTDGCVRDAQGTYTVSFKAGLFSEPPTVIGQNVGNSAYSITVASISTTSAQVAIRQTSLETATADIPFNLILGSNGADYITESEKIVTFPVDNITSNVVTLKGNDARAITASSEPIHFSGSGTGWVEGADGSTHTNGNYYTVQKNNSKVTLSFGIAISPGTTSSPIGTDIQVNGTSFRRVAVDYMGGDTAGNWGGSVTFNRGELSAGDKISLSSFRTVTLANSLTEHYLIISEEYGDRGIFIGNMPMERKEGNQTSDTDTVTADVFVDMAGASIALTEGEWEICYATSIFHVYVSGSSVGTLCQVSVRDGSNNTISNAQSLSYKVMSSTNDQTMFPHSMCVRQKITADTTYKLSLKAASPNTVSECEAYSSSSNFSSAITNPDLTSKIWANRIR